MIRYTATLHASIVSVATPGTVSYDLVDALRTDWQTVQFSDLDIDYILCRNCKHHVEHLYDRARERFDGRHLTTALNDTYVMESYLE